MRRYDIRINTDTATKRIFPYLIILQSDLLSSVATVLVAPLVKGQGHSRIAKLNPIVEVDGKPYAALVQEMAALLRKRLGAVKSNAAAQHTEFVAAIDLIFTGV